MIICVCTAGKDRSPAMVRAIMEALPGEDVRYGGTSRRRTQFNCTPHVSTFLGMIANRYYIIRPLVLCAARQHYDYVRGWLDCAIRFADSTQPIVINCDIRDFDGDLTERDKERLIRLVRRHYVDLSNGPLT